MQAGAGADLAALDGVEATDAPCPRSLICATRSRSRSRAANDGCRRGRREQHDLEAGERSLELRIRDRRLDLPLLRLSDCPRHPRRPAAMRSSAPRERSLAARRSAIRNHSVTRYDSDVRAGSSARRARRRGPRHQKGRRPVTRDGAPQRLATVERRGLLRDGGRAGVRLRGPQRPSGRRRRASSGAGLSLTPSPGPPSRR